MATAELSPADQEIVERVRPRFADQLSRSGHAAAVLEMSTNDRQRASGERLMRDLTAPYIAALGKAGLSGEALDSLRASHQAWIHEAYERSRGVK